MILHAVLFKRAFLRELRGELFGIMVIACQEQALSGQNGVISDKFAIQSIIYRFNIKFSFKKSN